MSITCDMAMDLVGIYCDGEASADTRTAVEEHLKDCSSCRAYYRRYKEQASKEVSIDKPNFRFETSGIDDELIAKNLKKLSKRLYTRQVINRTVAIVTAVIGLSAVLYEMIRRLKDK